MTTHSEKYTAEEIASEIAWVEKLSLRPINGYGGLKKIAEMLRHFTTPPIADGGEAVAKISGKLPMLVPEVTWFDAYPPVGTLLYIHPTPTDANSGGVPEGYVLMPAEPTEAMIDAGTAQHECEQGDSYYSAPSLTDGDCIAIYKAMLNASAATREG